MARFTMLSEKDRDMLMEEIYNVKWRGLDHFAGMMDVLQIMGLLDDWNEYVDRKESEIANSPERFRDCLN